MSPLLSSLIEFGFGMAIGTMGTILVIIFAEKTGRV